MKVLEAESISKSYGDLDVLLDETLSVEENEIHGILGKNGAGKTTFIEILGGWLIQDEGYVSVRNQRDDTEIVLPPENEVSRFSREGITERNDVQEIIGHIPAKEEPMSYITPREYLRLKQLSAGISEEDAQERIDYWADLLNFRQYLDTQSSDLSRGNQQKIIITKAFLANPSLLLIDEPLVNLDPNMQEVFKQELHRQVSEEDKSVVLATHNVDSALEMCDVIHIMHENSVATKRLETEAVRAEETTREELIDKINGDLNTGDS